LLFHRLCSFRSASQGEIPPLIHSSAEEEGSETSPKSKDSFDDKEDANSEKNESSFIQK